MSNEQRISLRFFETILHPCSYLPGQRAKTVVADPSYPMTAHLYGVLAAYGFRRSGDNIYRPACPDCNACVPVRIPVARFKPKRSQRRVARKNADLSVQVLPAQYHEQHFNLYRRYQRARHGDGEMARHTPDDYIGFLMSDWCKTTLAEMRLDDELLAVAVLDELRDGLSAVYTFFEPSYSQRSLGVHAILWAIDEVQRRNGHWLYLGYWIGECEKMAYKNEYLPQERLRDGQWMEWNGPAR
ncbi:MAG: arginyltransferase [Gammaproteobacteria bacterium]|nr:arginyltransferase [Gammaproteobacteria bacterium]